MVFEQSARVKTTGCAYRWRGANSDLKYFILQGYIPEVVIGVRRSVITNLTEGRAARLREWASDYGPTQPLIEGERRLVGVQGLGRISLFVHDVWTAHLLMAARSQEKAYRLALPFRAFATIYLGYPREEGLTEYLIELTQKPSEIDSTRFITENYLQPGLYSRDYEQALGTGYGLPTHHMRAGAVFVKQIVQSEKHELALKYLERSHYLLSGYMSGSYYYAHYRHERREQTPYQRRKNYLEMSPVYDLAFLSAFRSVEALLGCGARSLEKREIGAKLQALDDGYGTSFSTEQWHSLHHFFTTQRRHWSYEELIAAFLDTRNAVAAHANPSPPFPLSEDQVFELQNLAGSMVYDSIMPDDFDPREPLPA